MDNKVLESLFKLVLSIQKPSAPLYITKNMEHSKIIYKKIINKKKW